jgi:hypothetical protein
MTFFLNKIKVLTLVIICGFSACNKIKKDIIPDILPQFETGKNNGEIDNQEIDEASGIVASRNFAGNFWVHNDSGDKNRLFLINNLGKYQGAINIAGVQNRDWEDIAISKFPDNENYIFVADIGDNEASYKNEYFIYKFKEPKLIPNKNTVGNVDNIETIKFKYTDGPRDAETLLIDHKTKDLYIITKREARIRLYRIAAPQSTSSINIASFVTELPIGGSIAGVPTGATGGDISYTNNEIIIKSYFQIYYWKLAQNETILQALSRPFDKLLPYNPEPQGEGICFDATDTNYYTIGEAGESKNIVNLYFYKRK